MMTEEEKEVLEWLERLVKINKRDNLFNTFAEILLNKSDESKEESSMYYYNLYKNLMNKIKNMLQELKERENKQPVIGYWSKKAMLEKLLKEEKDDTSI